MEINSLGPLGLQLWNWKTGYLSNALKKACWVFDTTPALRNKSLSEEIGFMEIGRQMIGDLCLYINASYKSQWTLHSTQTQRLNNDSSCNKGWVPNQLPSCPSHTDQHIQHQIFYADQPKILQHPKTYEGSHSALWRSDKQNNNEHITIKMQLKRRKRWSPFVSYWASWKIMAIETTIKYNWKKIPFYINCFKRTACSESK
jgi:hypothetical protein